MKNWLSPEFGSDARAIEQTPRSCETSLNSAGSFLPEPPVPVAGVGSQQIAGLETEMASLSGLEDSGLGDLGE